MNSFTLTTEEQRKLLRWARLAIEESVHEKLLSPAPLAEITGTMKIPHAAFVTLKKHGELRGCIGSLDYLRPLLENVLDAAVASALEDSRFNPVQIDELGAIRLEISILDHPIDLANLKDFDPQHHGIIVEQGGKRALLLPKVAQELGWGAAQVLDAVCEKAGLEKDAWQSAKARLQVFTAYDFAEPQSP